MSTPVAVAIVRTRSRAHGDIVAWILPFDKAQEFAERPEKVQGAFPVNIDYVNFDDGELTDWLLHIAIPFETKFMIRDKYLEPPVDLSKLRAQFRHAAVIARNKQG